MHIDSQDRHTKTLGGTVGDAVRRGDTEASDISAAPLEPFASAHRLTRQTPFASAHRLTRQTDKGGERGSARCCETEETPRHQIFL